MEPLDQSSMLVPPFHPALDVGPLERRCNQGYSNMHRACLLLLNRMRNVHVVKVDDVTVNQLPADIRRQMPEITIDKLA